MHHSPLPTTADDIAVRILKLIQGTHGADDLAPAGIERATGLEVAYDRDDPSIYGLGAHMGDADWCYNLISLPPRADGDASRRLVFSFDDQSGRSQPPPVGRYDYDAYAQALRDAGYTDAMRLGPRGAFDGFTFTRDGVSVDVNVQGSEDQPQHLRVSSLIIDAKAVSHEQ